MTFTEPHLNIKYKILKTIILKIFGGGGAAEDIKLVSSGNKTTVISSLKICSRMFIFKEWNKLNDHCTEAEQRSDWDLFLIILAVSAWSFRLLTSSLSVTKMNSLFLIILKFSQTSLLCKFIQMVCLWSVYHTFAAVLLRQRCLCIKTTFVSNLRVL